jgi:ABC-2 type transport system ATP-binding protein
MTVENSRTQRSPRWLSRLANICNSGRSVLPGAAGLRPDRARRQAREASNPEASGSAANHGGASVLKVDGVLKRYGSLVAVADIFFDVRAGEIFGILGPNGAGKTTTLEMIEGLRSPDKGCITICGLDAERHRRAVKQRIGVQLQSQTLWAELTVQDTIQTFRSLYTTRVPMSTLLERFTLAEKRKAFVGNLSGGQRQRLALACAVVNDPEVVFLDEPTTGLDPQARLTFWDLIAEMRAEGKTIILTTHYMEEAEALCDRVAVMDRGRIIALGTPRELVRRLEFENTIECLFGRDVDVASVRSLKGVLSVRQQQDGTLFIFTREVARTMADVLDLAERERATIAGLQVRTATLEDVFISLTGRRLRD